MDRKISRERVARIVSDFLDGKRGNIEHIRISGGIGGLRDLYIIPIGVATGRAEIFPNVIQARLVTPEGKHFGDVAIKLYRTVVKDSDAPTLLPPTIAHGDAQIGNTPIPGRKLAVQMWMPKASAEEYLMEVAKIKHLWTHLVPKKNARHITISDIAPQNVLKWAVDLDVYKRDNARAWDKIAIQEFLIEYGEEAISAVEKLARVAGVGDDEIGRVKEDLKRGIVTDDVMHILERIWEKLPKRREFWEHHVRKDIEILNNVAKIAAIPKDRRDILERTAKYLRERGHENVPESFLHLAELERNIVAEWISAYKRALRRSKNDNKE